MTEHDDSSGRKPRWRDIDRKKDRGSHSPGERKKDDEGYLSSTQKELYLKQVDKLFGAKKLSKAEREGLKKMERDSGTPKFDSTVKKYIEKFGIPEDWGGLMLMLDYSDLKEVAQGVLPMLEKMYPERSDAEKSMLRYKLETMAMTSDDPLLEVSIEELLETL